MNQLRFPFPRVREPEPTEPGAGRRPDVFRRPLGIDAWSPGASRAATAPSGPQAELELPATPPASRDVTRSRRKRDVRARTISVKRLPKHELELGRALYPEDEHADVKRPMTRADCQNGVRPCPFVSCAHHLYLDVSARTGAIKVNFPDLEPDELADSCALDVADRGGETLERVGAIMNLTRERVRQVEVKGLAKLHACGELQSLRDVVDDGRPRRRSEVGRRRLPMVDHQEADGSELQGDEHADAGVDFDADEFASEALDSD